MAEPAASYELNNPPVIAEMLEGEVVAIDLDAGNYYCVRGPSAAVWNALVAGATPVAIATAAAAEPAPLLEALLGFVDRLLGDHLLRRRAGAPATPAMAPLPAWKAGELTYDIFTDMQNLLGLDPVHEADDRLGWPAPAAPATS